MGDFNTTRLSSERSGRNMLNDTAMNDFHECLFSLELADVHFLGPLFTWMNRQAGVNFIARKLGRCLQNECSLDLFPNAFTEVLPPGLSDHCPLVTSLKVNSDPGPRKLFPFKFFNFLADHPDLIGLVKEAWSNEVFRTPMFRLTRKLKCVKAILKAFNFRSFGRLHERVVAAREALCQAQSAVLNNASNPMLGENEKSCLKNYHDLAEDALSTGVAKAIQNWRSLFVNRPKPCTPLVYSNPSRVDGKVIINPPSEAVEEGLGIWEGCLVGQFFDKRLPLHVVKIVVERLWGMHEMPEISTTDNGLYIFRFVDRVARDWVLENGPWYFFGRPIILRSWKPGMEMLNVQITSLPIWVKFFNIPLEY